MANLFELKVDGIETFNRISRNYIKPETKIRESLRPLIRQALLHGRRVSKDSAPVESGLLRSSIQFRSKRSTSSTIFALGEIFIDLDKVPYGRRQNYEHTTKGFFLEKGIEAAKEQLLESLRGQRLINILLFPRKGSFDV